MPNREYMSAKIIAIRDLNDRVREFTITPQQAFEYQPGQYIKVRADDTTRKADYTLVNYSPQSDELVFAVDNHPDSMVGNQLHELGVGDTVIIKGPYGRFSVDPNQDELVMISHSIGITTIPGNLEFLRVQNYKGEVRVVNIFEKHFDSIYQESISSYKTSLNLSHHTIDENDVSKKKLRKGKIPKNIFKSILNGYEDGIVYISGHKKPIKKIRKKLDKLGVENIKLEKF